MKLKFIIDKAYDTIMLVDLLNDVRNAKDFAKIIDIDYAEAQKIFKGKTIKAQENAIRKMVERDYRNLMPYLKNSVKNYQLSWDKINNNFFKLVYKITKYQWRYQKYYCVVSIYHKGLSSWGGNKIMRIWSENPDTQIRITAHEISLSHIWTILEKEEKSKNWPEQEKWQYSEVISWCLLGLDSRFDKFWPWAKISEKFPINHNYPKFLKMQMRCKKLYLKEKNFKKFLDTAIELTKKELK